MQEAPVSASERVQSLFHAYRAAGIKPFDALHLASAVALGVDYFCSTDDRLLRKGKEANTASTRVVTPLELTTDLDL